MDVRINVTSHWFTLLSKELGSLDVSIIYEADIGHIPPQMQIINGSIGNVEFTDGKAIIGQRLKW